MKKLVLLILALCALAGCGGAEEPVESMTGLESIVNVHISGISYDK